MTSFLVGGYGPGLRGTAEGIGVVRSGLDGRLEWAGLAAEIPSPSWLILHEGVVHAALEETGEIASFAVQGTALRLLSRHPAAGAAPCHLAVSAGALVVACYGSGALGVHRLEPSGAAGPLSHVLPGTGHGPRPAQTGPHAHHVLVLEDGRTLSADLGTDQIHLQRWAGGRLVRTGSVGLPAGTGPRDLLLLPDGAVAVLGEWGCSILLLQPDREGFTVVAETRLPDAREGDQAAGLARSADGRNLYAGVRGPDRVARVGRSGTTLNAVESVPSGGAWPRSLIVAGDLLHVTNQRSGTVSSHRVGPDGALRALGDPTVVPTPTRLLLLGDR